jgi:hypothetical protein
MDDHRPDLISIRVPEYIELPFEDFSRIYEICSRNTITLSIACEQCHKLPNSIAIGVPLNGLHIKSTKSRNLDFDNSS